ncbi:hypothetical protein AC579_7512 [Pseudocercospora musae]|uniref:G-protein coupled receptors family 2 profile 2 domain-containing protein n=1 Tax=Pseudocercospora musae TaxID=113226 RepID=A0A139H4T0_9PEZI|nr:hypothetical protein AC579_7512 [Pseudocercospora musae]KXS97412.1 hypothetical protein AC579_7512 [Pseudocercospora musae]KXS97414.1 hypothetical protein AC579_7512 [Pseudocercospora musae]
MSNTTTSACPAPFLAAADYPATGGCRYTPTRITHSHLPSTNHLPRSTDIHGRSCSAIAPGTSCCLPCPAAQYIYSRSFPNNLQIAYWFNLPSLLFEILLLATFLILSREVSHTHYLSINLVIAMIMLQISFIIPLGTRPSQCYDAITPRDMDSSLSCAWTGALLVAGAMAIAVWIMLRSIWMHLRICWDVRSIQSDSKTWFFAAHALGWGIPAIFLAVELTVTGVSYRIGGSCLPNQEKAFATWFGWLIAFGGVGALVQFVTTGFCVGVYLKEVMNPKSQTRTTTRAASSAARSAVNAEENVEPNMTSYFVDPQDQKKLAWSRVRKILRAQWRSMVLCTVLVILLIYYGVVFVQQTSSAFTDVSPAQAQKLQAWAICIVINRGDKRNCGPAAKALGLSEGAIVATYYMAAFVGIFSFTLMFRSSMLKGWLFFIRHPRRAMRNPSIGEQPFFMLDSAGTKRKSFGRPLESERRRAGSDGGGRKSIEEPMPTMPYYHVSSGEPRTDPHDVGILPDSRNTSIAEITPPVTRRPSFVPRNDSTTLGPIPEAGNVSRRHVGPDTGIFQEEHDPYDVPKRTRVIRRGGNEEEDLV